MPIDNVTVAKKASRLSHPISLAAYAAIVPLVAPYVEEALKAPSWPGIAIAVLSGVLSIIKSVEA